MKIRKIRRALNHRVLNVLPDKLAIKMAFLRAHGFLPNLTHPRSFSEKVQHRKLFDRNALMPLFADKEKMKRLVADIVGGDAFTPKTHWVGTDIGSVDLSAIPRPFVVKPTHLSGYVRFFREGDSLDPESLANECRSWLNIQFGRHNREWVYRGIQPRILVEEMLGDGPLPPDYKLWVFGAKVELIQVDVTRFDKHARALFDPLWSRLPVTISYSTPALEIPRPATLEVMISVAERLGAMFDFVRVDLYEHRGRVAVGELTFYPESGLGRISPASFDFTLGEKWPSSQQSIGNEYRRALSNQQSES